MSNRTEDTVNGRVDRSPGNDMKGDVWISFKRWLVKNLRNPYVVFTSLVQPVIFLVLFAEVFGVVAGDTLTQSFQGEVNYITFLTPAILIMSALASAATSGIGLVTDMEEGMFEKILVSPMNRTAMFLGKMLSEVVRIVIQTLIILLLGYMLLTVRTSGSVDQYMQTGLVGVIGVVLVTVIFGGVFMAYSNIVALVSRDEEATIMFANLLTFPLLFVSSAFLPLDVLPGWIRAVAVLNPITYGIDGVRALMLGRDVMTVLTVTGYGGLWNTLVPAVGILVGFNIVLGTIARRLLRRAARAEVQ
ncbi:ABC transporter permease [Haloarcula salinisoli]|uniref:ABC transporter permease n=1 Tax=Haloarcula salinisoli TaxID=2487746 RepID=A0A8J8CES7_9EURY|nr:ABC transporter permease [Halomicroarcula salinisoli]MBX0288595.1 ABC transporter permease [Halomicroarcula salinisoli]MBX0306025.1 ABC transporter permease [Halomicroarcula salinisoli]